MRRRVRSVSKFLEVNNSTVLLAVYYLHVHPMSTLLLHISKMADVGFFKVASPQCEG